MLAKTATRSDGNKRRHAPPHGGECTQLALDTLLGAQDAAVRRPPFHVTPAHVLVGLMRQRRSVAGQLLLSGGLTEERVWSAFDYRKWGVRGMQRLRDPVLLGTPRWTRRARELVASAQHQSGLRDTAVIDTLDLLAAIADIDDPFAAHLLAAAHLGPIKPTAAAHDAHLDELERSPTTQLPSFTALHRLHA